MRIRLFFLSLAIALATPAGADEWTSFTGGTLSGYSFGHDHLPDGRFVFGIAGGVSVEDTFGGSTFAPVANGNATVFDPSFVAIRSASSGLIGGGGFFGPSGLFPFDPSVTATDVGTALATLQNYAAVYWVHPSSGREGWLISGGNASGGENNLTFVSADGLHSGPVTGVLSAFSGGVATDSAGQVFTVLADFDAAIDNQVHRFSADQIDAAVAAILSGTPSPLAKGDAANPFQANASGAVAVDGLGRLWFGGYQIDHLQAFDSATGVTRRFFPDHPALQGAAGPPSYAPKAFSRMGVDYLSFLANDSYYATDSELRFGYKPVSDLAVRSVQFTEASGTAIETDGSVTVTITIAPPPTVPVTVPLVIAGTATRGEDFEMVDQITFGIGESQADLVIDLTDYLTAMEAPETVIVTLGEPEPVSEAGLGQLGTETFTLTILDNEVAPRIDMIQTFGPLRVGTAFQHTLTTTGGTATRWSAKGLPPGLRIDPLTGVISGTPVAAGEFDRIVITASNPYGKTVSVVYLMMVESVPEMAFGSFFALVDRVGPETGGLGASLRFSTTAKGSWSGVVTVGRGRYRVRGRLDTSAADPTLTATFKHQGVPLTLEVVIDAATGVLSGGFSGGGVLTGWKAVSDSERGGFCHWLLAVPGGPPSTVPEGTGFGTVRFGKRSTARITGRLADGSRFSSAGGIGPNGEVLVYQALYGNPGTLLGELQVADDLALSVSGDFTWSKPAQTKGNAYRDGWPVPLSLGASGGKYRPVDGATLPLDVAESDAANAGLLLQDGGIDAWGTNPQSFDARIVSKNRVLLGRPHRLSINNAKGTFGGYVWL
ncbi:MAG: hypothetical protein KDL87_06560, partial [Verrucomicrobiae bacterium]|nr:hypothetical protein [Verrucomicrobiae bacterium]